MTPLDLGGGFKCVLFSPLFGEMIQFASYFSNGLKNRQLVDGWEVQLNTDCCFPAVLLLWCLSGDTVPIAKPSKGHWIGFQKKEIRIETGHLLTMIHGDYTYIYIFVMVFWFLTSQFNCFFPYIMWDILGWLSHSWHQHGRLYRVCPIEKCVCVCVKPWIYSLGGVENYTGRYGVSSTWWMLPLPFDLEHTCCYLLQHSAGSGGRFPSPCQMNLTFQLLLWSILLHVAMAERDGLV